MAYPLKVQIDLPVPTRHPDDPGYAYEHRFNGPDTDYTFDHLWRDPARRTLLLQPAQLDPAWFTSSAGLFRRYGLTDYLTAAVDPLTNWVAYNRPTKSGFTGDTFMLANVSNEKIVTAHRYGVNQAFFLRVEPYGIGGNRQSLLDFEWGMLTFGGEAKYRYSLQLDGRFQFAKDGVDVLTGYVTPGGKDRTPLNGRYLELMFLPYRRNEILFWSSLGGHHVYTDTSLSVLTPNGPTLQGTPLDPEGAIADHEADPGYDPDEDPPYDPNTDPDVERYADSLDEYVITRPGYAAINFPTSKGNFQLSPLAFVTDGDGLGTITPKANPGLPYAPNSANFPSGQDIETAVDQDVFSGTGTSLAHGLVADGTDAALPWSLTLAGSVPDAGNPTQADKSPFVYGFSVDVPTGAAESLDLTSGMTNYIKALTIEQGEDGATASLEIKDPLAIDGTGLVRRALHRAVRIYCDNAAGGEDELFIGIATEPEYEEWADSPDGVNHAPVTFHCRDFWHLFENTQIKNIRAFDGMTLYAAVNKVLDVLGWPANRRDIDDFGVTLPSDPTGDEKVLLTDQVATGKDILDNFNADYTISDEPPYHAVMGFFPRQVGDDLVIFFCMKDPATFHGQTGTNANRTLYATRATVLAAGLDQSAAANTYRRQVLEPESNWVIVGGEDPNEEPLWEQRFDPASFDPALPYVDRPDNWIGIIRETVYYSPQLNTPEYVAIATLNRYLRLSRPRYMAEWTARGLPSDGVFLRHKMKADGDRIYTVTGITTEFILETSGSVIRNATYRGEARQ